MIGRNAKAWSAGVLALAAYLMGVLDPTALGLEAFATVTTTQWLGAVLAIGAAYGLTWAVPNRDSRPFIEIEGELHTFDPESGATSKEVATWILLAVAVVALIGFWVLLST